jgi:hypothetical protein
VASPITLLKSFNDGQGAGAQTYVTYDGDLDSNFTILEASFNTLTTEVKASGAGNAALVFDMLQSSSPAVSKGIVGIDSFAPVTFPTTASITIPAGVAVAADSRIASIETTLFASTADSWWITLNQNGTVTLETAADVGVLDLYTIDTTGLGIFTQASLTLVADIMPDGDDFQNQKIILNDSQGSVAGIPVHTYNVIADRLNDMHRVMLGQTTSTDTDQAALNGMAFAGSEALPGFMLSNGTSFENTTGFYRAAVNEIGVSVLATNVARFAETTANEPQLRMRAGTALGDPPISWLSDTNTGFGWVSADVHRAIAGGVEAFRFAIDGASGVRAAFVGNPDTGSNPGLAVIGDLDTGFLSTAADTLQVMTGGTEALDVSSVGQLTSGTQFRVATTDAAFNITNSGTLTDVQLATETFDIGGWHDNVTNPDRHTVPTGGGGRYLIIGEIEFPAGSLNGIRHIALTVGGTVVKEMRVSPASAGETVLTISAIRDLAATDIVRVQAAHTDTTTPLSVRSAVEIVRLVA